MKYMCTMLFLCAVLNAKGANDEPYKLAFSKNNNVDIYTDNEEWCSDNVLLEFKLNDTSNSKDDISLLFQKMIQVIKSQCEMVSAINAQIKPNDSNGEYTLVSTLESDWVVNNDVESESIDSEVDIKSQVAAEDDIDNVNRDMKNIDAEVLVTEKSVVAESVEVTEVKEELSSLDAAFDEYNLMTNTN